MFKPRTLSIGLILTLVAALTLSLGVVSADNDEEEVRLGGSVVYRDDGGNASAKVVIALSGLPALPDGMAYEGWLIGVTGDKVSTGVMRRSFTGAMNGSYVDPDGENLLTKYTAFAITKEPSPDPDPATPGEVVYADSINEGAAPHVGRLLVKWRDAPDETAAAVGLRDQIAMALAHAEAAEEASSMVVKQRHAQRVINILQGDDGADYARAVVPGASGDGLGAMNYADAVIAVAQGAAADSEGDADVQAAAGMVVSHAGSAVAGMTQAVNNAKAVISASSDDFAFGLRLENVRLSLERAHNSADDAYVSSQNIATFVPILGATPEPPSVGDALVRVLALGVLIAGLAAAAAGVYLLLGQRRRVAA
ncbi:MAG: anti-sigma factor [Dehalococcoidia bacterium]|nr:anti-sigma factor [Dehalococcoidia bacterium]